MNFNPLRISFIGAPGLKRGDSAFFRETLLQRPCARLQRAEFAVVSNFGAALARWGQRRLSWSALVRVAKTGAPPYFCPP